jgi:tetratricopeptide (TPR) repeat protein
MKFILLLCLLWLTPVASLQSQDDANYGPLVQRVQVNGRPRLTVIATDIPAKEVVRMIARAYELQLVGLENLKNRLVSAHLKGRDLNSTLEMILGSLDMQHKRHGKVLEIMPLQAQTSDELFAKADTAWASFYRRFPTHPMAPHAQFSRASIQEKRNKLSAARDIYLKLAKDYPLSMEVGPAMLRAGIISANQNENTQAATIFRDLIKMAIPTELQASARMELARALIGMNDPKRALNLLRALEADYPSMDKAEATVRRLIRARALNKMDQPYDALREIDLLDKNFNDLAAWESLHIRATAFEKIGLFTDASRAWLHYAINAIGKDRSQAFASAARLALQADDELAVLFIAETAAEDGLAEGLEEFVTDAKVRLGLIEAQPTSDRGSSLDEAEALVNVGEILRAMKLLGPLYRTRSSMIEVDLRARLTVLWARCKENQNGLDEAIALLKLERSTFSSTSELNLIDIGAADLFTKHDQFLEAARAYQGEFGQ